MHRFLVTLCLVALHMSLNSMGAPSDYDSDYVEKEEIILDTSNPSAYKVHPTFDVQMPASCKGENFCFEKDKNYPDEAVKKLLEKLPMLPMQGQFGTDFTDRDGPETPECPTNTSFVDKPIYYIVDENDKTRAVVQSENFTQIYSAKWCQYPGRITYGTPHFLAGSRLLKDFKVECVNKYMNFDFLVLADEGKAQMVKAKNGIPVCCRCQYPEP